LFGTFQTCEQFARALGIEGSPRMSWDPEDEDECGKPSTLFLACGWHAWVLADLVVGIVGIPYLDLIFNRFKFE
jgi:hypothetical protein